MAKGFRVPPQSSKKEAQKKLETEMANTQMAGRISQMMTQQLMQNVKSMSEDLNAVVQQMTELQYKLNAVQSHFNLDPVELNKLANVQRLADFNEASVKADLQENLLPSDVVAEDSTIVITSTAADADGNDRGVFRSRVKLSECGVPDLIQALQGKSIGDKVITKLNGLDHTVELLSINNPSPQPTPVLDSVPAQLQVVQ
jgi:hypothetical protein